MPSDRGDQMETGQRSKSLRSLSTFFSDRNDRNDHMETGLKVDVDMLNTVNNMLADVSIER